jgi:hypothetical protein
MAIFRPEDFNHRDKVHEQAAGVQNDRTREFLREAESAIVSQLSESARKNFRENGVMRGYARVSSLRHPSVSKLVVSNNSDYTSAAYHDNMWIEMAIAKKLKVLEPTYDTTIEVTSFNDVRKKSLTHLDVTASFTKTAPAAAPTPDSFATPALRQTVDCAPNDSEDDDMEFYMIKSYDTLESLSFIPSRYSMEEFLDDFDGMVDYYDDDDSYNTAAARATYWDDMNVYHHRAAKRYRGQQDYLLEILLDLQPGQLVYVQDARSLH